VATRGDNASCELQGAVSAIGQLRQVEVEQGWVGDEHAGDLGAGERVGDAGRIACAGDYRSARCVRRTQRLVVVDSVDHERAVEIDRPLKGDGRDLPARCAEPALPHGEEATGAERPEGTDENRGDVALRDPGRCSQAHTSSPVSRAAADRYRVRLSPGAMSSSSTPEGR